MNCVGMRKAVKENHPDLHDHILLKEAEHNEFKKKNNLPRCEWYDVSHELGSDEAVSSSSEDSGEEEGEEVDSKDRDGEEAEEDDGIEDISTQPELETQKHNFDFLPFLIGNFTNFSDFRNFSVPFYATPLVLASDHQFVSSATGTSVPHIRSQAELFSFVMMFKMLCDQNEQLRRSLETAQMHLFFTKNAQEEQTCQYAEAVQEMAVKLRTKDAENRKLIAGVRKNEEAQLKILDGVVQRLEQAVSTAKSADENVVVPAHSGRVAEILHDMEFSGRRKLRDVNLARIKDAFDGWKINTKIDKQISNIVQFMNLRAMKKCQSQKTAACLNRWNRRVRKTVEMRLKLLRMNSRRMQRFARLAFVTWVKAVREDNEENEENEEESHSGETEESTRKETLAKITNNKRRFVNRHIKKNKIRTSTYLFSHWRSLAASRKRARGKFMDRRLQKGKFNALNCAFSAWIAYTRNAKSDKIRSLSDSFERLMQFATSAKATRGAEERRAELDGLKLDYSVARCALGEVRTELRRINDLEKDYSAARCVIAGFRTELRRTIRHKQAEIEDLRNELAGAQQQVLNTQEQRASETRTWGAVVALCCWTGVGVAGWLLFVLSLFIIYGSPIDLYEGAVAFS